MNPNTPAFPHLPVSSAFGYTGMTLRQYAAIQIAAGLAASDFWSGNVMDGPGDDTDRFRRNMAKCAVQTADTLRAEIAKGEK